MQARPSAARSAAGQPRAPNGPRPNDRSGYFRALLSPAALEIKIGKAVVSQNRSYTAREAAHAGRDRLRRESEHRRWPEAFIFVNMKNDALDDAAPDRGVALVYIIWTHDRELGFVLARRAGPDVEAV